MGGGNTKNSKLHNQNEQNQDILDTNKQDNINSSQNSILGDNLEADLQMQYDYSSQIDPIVNHSLFFKDINLTSTIEIYLSCQNLQNMDIMSFSDPYVRVQIEERGEWTDLGQTEIIPDNLDPKFASSFIIKYNIDDPPRLKFDVYDVDECINIKKAEQTEHMGEADCKLDDLLNDKDIQLKIPLLTNKNQPKKNEKINQPTRFLKIKGYPHDKFNYQYIFKLQLEGFKSKQEIYIRINKQVKNQYYPLYMTECVKNNQKGILQFQQFNIADAKILDSNVLQFQVFEFIKSSTKLKLLGEQNIEIDKLKQVFQSNNSETIKFFKGKSLLGVIQIVHFKKYMYNYDFLKYIYGGCNLKIMLALDFSNPYCYHEGDKYSNSSQELIEENEKVISIAQKTMKILSHLDGTSKIVTYGFGSKMPPYKNFHSNCFALSSDFFDPELDSIDKIKERFQINLQTMSFSQLSIYSEVINQARKITEKNEFSNKEQTYTVLVIISKGNLYSPDLQQCLDEIVLSSYQPMSIINVGIHDGNYSYVPILEPEANEQNILGAPLYSQKLDMEAERNNFHFINYSLHEDDINKRQFSNGLFKLIPENFLKYARKRNIHPVRLNLSEKEATQGFFERKIQLMKQPTRIDWLQQEQKLLYDELVYNLQHPAWIIRKILEQGLPCLDINYILERISYEKNYQGVHRYNNDSFLQHQLNIMDKNKLKQRVLKIHSNSSQKQNNIKKKDNIDSNYYSKKILSAGKNENNNNIYKKRNQDDEQLAHFFQRKLQDEYKDINEQILENDEYNLHKNKFSQICVLCQINLINITLMPCGHAYCCLKCYNLIQRKKCPSCNHQVTNIVDIVTSNNPKIIQHQNNYFQKEKNKQFTDQIDYQIQSEDNQNNDFLTPDQKSRYSSQDLSNYMESSQTHQINLDQNIDTNKEIKLIQHMNKSKEMKQSFVASSFRDISKLEQSATENKKNTKKRQDIQINVIDNQNWQSLFKD